MGIHRTPPCRRIFNCTRGRCLLHNPMQAGRSATSSLRTKGMPKAHVERRPHPPWEDILRTFFLRLSSSNGASSLAANCSTVYASACTAMQACLSQHRPREALDVYQALCGAGIAMTSVPGGTLGGRASHKHSDACPTPDELALEALRQVPHCIHQFSLVAMLTEAEHQMGHEPPSHSSWESYRGSAPAVLCGPVSAAEHYRITLRQRLHFLKSIDCIQQPIGRNFILATMQDVVASPVLRQETGASVLAELSRRLLWHPFSYHKPTEPWAQHAIYMESLGATHNTLDLPPSHVKHLMAVEESIYPVRRLCRHPVVCLSALAPTWDNVLYKRVAQTMLLPDDAHEVIPRAYRRPPTRRRSHRAGTRPEGRYGAEARDRDSAWVDARHELFGSSSGVHSLGALHRTEGIVRRRVFHDVVVPDARFVLTHFQQLQQLARHREVLLSHGVLLVLVDVASQVCGSKGFHARRVLRALMQATTSRLTRDYTAEMNDVHMVYPRHRWCRGVTVLGLQDEMVLLEDSPDRFLQGSSDGSVSTCTDVADPCDPAEEETSVPCDALSAVLIAKQLERMIAAHDQGRAFATDAPQGTSLGLGMDRWGSDSEAHAEVLAFPSRGERCVHPDSGRPFPFKGNARSRPSRRSVMVATTTARTRLMSYMAGLSMYPPASCV